MRDRAADDGAERDARRGRRAERQIIRQRAAERPVAERRTRRAERQTQERGLVRRRQDGYRGSGETDATLSRRVERAGRQAKRESKTTKWIRTGDAVPEKKRPWR
jgi:hypothetical protein